jgi:hypothetical protein
MERVTIAALPWWIMSGGSAASRTFKETSSITARFIRAALESFNPKERVASFA